MDAKPPNLAVGPRRTIEVDGTFNFRDVGGGLTAAGEPVAAGRLFRSASLGELTDRGLATIDELGIRTVVDLRSAAEIEHHGRFPQDRPGVRWLHVASPVSPPSGAASSTERAVLDHPDPMSLLFRLMVDRGTGIFTETLRAMVEPDALPLVFHCTSGKDRTGLVAVVTQLIVGVDLDDVLADFEYSAELVRAGGHDMTTRFPAMAELPPERVARMHAADRSWVLGAIDEIGGLDQLGPWLDGIGVDSAVRAELRRLLLAPAP